jgi:pyruvate,water dikinase
MTNEANVAKDQAYVVPFEQLRMTDVDIVGGKNASLGEMISQLAEAGVQVPTGFATTAQAFRDFLNHNNLTERIAKRLELFDVDDVKALAEAGKEIRQWIVDAPMQPRLEELIRKGFDTLQASSPEDCRRLAGCIVRGSAGKLSERGWHRRSARSHEARVRVAV